MKVSDRVGKLLTMKAIFNTPPYVSKVSYGASGTSQLKPRIIQFGFDNSVRGGTGQLLIFPLTVMKY